MQRPPQRTKPSTRLKDASARALGPVERAAATPPRPPLGHVVLAGADSADYQSLRRRPTSRAERFELGRSLREQVPFSSLGDWKPTKGRPDPIEQIKHSHARGCTRCPARRRRASRRPDALVIQARWTSDGSDACASHGHERPPACASAKKLAQVLRELRAEKSRTGRLSDAGPPPRGTCRSAPNPAWRRGSRK